VNRNEKLVYTFLRRSNIWLLVLVTLTFMSPQGPVTTSDGIKNKLR
jgi:hypothetical protein